MLFINNNNIDVVAGVLTVKQQEISFDNIIDYDGLIITTNLPVVKEYVGSSSSFPVLNDFSFAEMNINSYHNRIIYNAITPYRQVSINSDSSIYNIQCRPFLTQPNGTVTAVELGPNQSANIKIMFVMKDTCKFA